MDFVLKNLDEILQKIRLLKNKIEKLERENRELKEENDHLKSEVEDLRQKWEQQVDKEAWGIFAGEWATKEGSKEKAIKKINETLKLIDTIVAGLKNEE